MKKIINFLKTNFINLIIIFATILGFITTYTIAATKVIMIKANIVNVRTGPMLSYNVIGQIKKGDQVEVIKSQNGWYLIRLNGDTFGWIASWLTDSNEIDSATNLIGIVTSNQANIRMYNNTDSNILTTLNKGAKFKVVYTNNDWSQIVYQDQVGWIYNKLFTISKDTEIPQTQNVYVIDSLTKLLDSPSKDAEVIKNLNKAEKLTVISAGKNYYKVSTESGNIGFVASNLISTEIPKKINIVKPKNISEAKIVLDPGHGGSDPGAQTNDGKDFEKNYTIKFIKELQQKLEKAGAKVVLLRNNDNYVSLEDRVQKTNQTEPNAFISIHFDSSNDANQASGFTTYYYSANKDLKLAQTISNDLTNLPLQNRGVAFGNYEVLRDNNYPCVLLELGYMNNDQDFKQISNSNYQDKVTTEITNGLKDYFK